MNKVKEILFNFPDATEVSLENCKLASLDEVMPDLIKLKQLRVLRIGNNLLKKLPADMSGLARLEFLDLTNNEFTDLGSIMSGLFSLPSLKHLYINLPEADEDEIIISLTNLESFNGTPLTDIPDTDYPTPTYSINSNDVRHANIHASSDNEVEVQVSSTTTTTTTATTTPTTTIPPTATMNTPPIDLTLIKNLFLSVNKFTNIRNEVEMSKHWSDLCSRVNFNNTDSTEAQRILLNGTLLDFVEKLKIIQPSIYPIVNSAFSVYDTLLVQSHSHTIRITNELTTKIKSMQKDLEHSDHEIGQLLEAAEILERDTLENEAVKKKLIEQFESEKEKLVEEVGFLRAELEKHKNKLRQFQLNRQKISTQVNTSPRQLLNASKSMNNSELGMSKHNVKTNKILSLKQICEIIEDIYASKAKFDQKCIDNQLPRETMEQHLYTYLNQKYGLKNLILEWASAIVQAIKRYSSEDNSVAVFGKILRNEIDEEFRFVQRQLCDTVAELLRVYVKGKYPRKVDSEIIAILQKKMGSGGVLNEEEWVDIIKYMYNKEDSVNVIVKVQDAINKLNMRRQKNKKENLRDNKIPYNEFLKVLLDFQLKGHERFLAKFVKLFRQYDSDRNGILNELEFRKLLIAINPGRSESDIDYWLNSIDPWNNQQITFSECVTFLSADLVKMMQESKKAIGNEQSAYDDDETDQQDPYEDEIEEELAEQDSEDDL